MQPCRCGTMARRLPDDLSRYCRWGRPGVCKLAGHMTNREKSIKVREKHADRWTLAGNWSFQSKIHTGVRGKCNPGMKRPQTQKLPLMLSALFHASDSLARPLSSKHLIHFIFFHLKDPNGTLLNGASCCSSVSADEAGAASLRGTKHHIGPISGVIALRADGRRSCQVTAAKSKTGR